ncbi:DUF4861 domain-containing protein [Sphingobacterium alkalisoli]|uniref:DUF4861 domain-containing protein n=1 Tax=Sphingobacterium alkalisoli TaxID=1874115 RepID=A0A4U0H8M4_9SPHI|nr:DUF4861 family protein [Sphingobacterium alkalisoli]TJY68171.1 DUF4861 domain-containing protein [Sphingobacterium alkalisoli]GGH08535.1 DUF4861 domain-containing protein [Sphingobacterium alkalisoli]
MKKVFLLFLVSLTILSGYGQNSLKVKNTTPHIRKEVVSIPYDNFTRHFKVDSIFLIKDMEGSILPHQLEMCGSNVPQNVLIEVVVNPKSTLTLFVSTEKPPMFLSKTYARYIPERFDDFAWENNVVAFRLYGKALEGRSDDAQGMDFWAKRTEDLIINKWYKGENYHKDHGEGLDYYAVGQTLGAGDMAFYYNSELQYTKHYREFEILDNGPLRTTFRLKFHPERINGNNISLSKTISLDAGSQFNKITIAFSNMDAQVMPIVVGVAKRNETSPEFMVTGKKRTFAYWEPIVGDNGHTGIALILPRKKIKFISSKPTQFLFQTTVRDSEAYTYYSGAAWDKAGRFTTAGTWFDEVKRVATILRNPLRVTLE